MLANKYVICVFICLVIWYSTRGIKKKTIETKNGNITGYVLTNRKGGEFYAFQGIPYGKPPTGNRRFQVSELANPWKDILDGTRKTPRCLQHEAGELIGSEDCLYLNVYTAKLPEEEPKTLLPVMVFIHGGIYCEGSTTKKMYGPSYLMSEEIVLVVINYRLGALGFLHLVGPFGVISNNNGLKDQRLALQWIQNNIKDYGGDPNLVTIFGQGTGGGSAHAHMFSPGSKGLFHRVIAQSGSANAQPSINGTINTAVELANVFGISTTNKKDMVTRLQKMDAAEIVAAQNRIEWSTRRWNGKPVIEGRIPDAFITDCPEKVMASGKYNQVPLMIGYTNKESMQQEILAYHNRRWGRYDRYDIDDDVPEKFEDDARDMIGEEMRVFYYHTKHDIFLRDYVDEHIAARTDVWYKHPIVRAVRLQSKFNPVYLYEFGGDTELNFYKKLSPETEQWPGASHHDDLGYLFENKFNPPKWFWIRWYRWLIAGSVEDLLIDRMVRMWTNFAKYGKPIVKKEELFENKEWLPVTEDDLYVMRITDTFKLEVLKEIGIDFWDRIYKEYGKVAGDDAF